MRVTHIIDLLRVGGAQKLLVTFAEIAQARDAQVSVVSLRHDDAFIRSELEANGARVWEFPGHGLLDPLRLRRLLKFVHNQHPDVIHTHLSYANIVGTLAGRLAGVPVVSSLHNVQDDPRHAHPIRQRLETWALRVGTRRVVAVGHVVAEANRARLRGKPIEVIPNAVSLPPALSTPERARVRAELVGDAQRPLLIAVGRLTPQKGYGDLLAAFAEVRREHPTASLVIVGSGTDAPQVSAQAADLGLDGAVVLLGRRNDVPRLLAASDLFVSASLWEGLPVALLEAMAAGLPVVATGVGEVPRVVVDGTGVVVPPGAPAQLAAAMRSLLDQPGHLLHVGAAARAHIACHYGSAVWVDRLLTLYESVRLRPEAVLKIPRGAERLDRGHRREIGH